MLLLSLASEKLPFETDFGVCVPGFSLFSFRFLSCSGLGTDPSSLWRLPGMEKKKSPVEAKYGWE